MTIFRHLPNVTKKVKKWTKLDIFWFIFQDNFIDDWYTFWSNRVDDNDQCKAIEHHEYIGNAYILKVSVLQHYKWLTVEQTKLELLPLPKPETMPKSSSSSLHLATKQFF